MKFVWRWAGVCLALAGSCAVEAQGNSWIGTWAASPQPAGAGSKNALAKIEDQTVRERVRVSVGGAQIRIQLSNEYGSTPLVIGAVTVARPSDPATVQGGSIRAVTFGGQKGVKIAAGAPALSDPIAFAVANGEEISISIYFPKGVATPTLHWLALKRAVISQRGDHTGDEKIEGGAMSKASMGISAVLAPARPSQRLVVAFGDSLTDGDQSTVDADHNWPEELKRRLRKTAQAGDVAVINEGIVGNRLLSDCFLPEIGCLGVSALARFERDALALPGVTHIVLLEGINDIGFPGAKLSDRLLANPAHAPTVEELTAAYRQLISRAHARGVKVIGATMTPIEGVEIPGYYSESKEACRQAVNQWIRSSGAFDGVIDFDAVLRDPERPSRLLAKYSSEDHIHPNDDGYRAMAEAIDLNWFK